MSKLLKVVIKNRKITIFIIVMTFVFGLFNYSDIPKQENPEVSTPFAIITALYPGASAADVERLVASKIENKIYEIEGYDYSTSESMDSLAIIQFVLEVDTNLDEAFRELREKMDDLQSELPDQVEEINIETDYFETTGILLGLSGQEYSYDELANYAEQIERRLVSVNGLQRIEVVGELMNDIIVEVDEKQLNYYDFGLNDIVGNLQVQNIEIPSGKIGIGSNKINVKSKGTFESIDEVKKIILDVSDSNGSVVRLQDLAEVNFKLEDSAQKIKHNGNNAVLIAGYFKENQNVVDVGEEIRIIVNELKAELPDGLEFSELIFQPESVDKAVDEFIGNLMQGVLFVIIVVFLGMGFRNAIVVSFAIPMSIVMTFIIMRITGYEIHQMSITALIIALGMLVDNAIVVSDAIQVRIDNREETIDAVINGVKEVAIPILTSTLTTVAVFLPLMLLQSVAGEFIRSIPMVVMTALISSYLVALFVTPTLAYLFFKPSTEQNKYRFNMKSTFINTLKLAMDKKWVVVIIILISMGSASFMVNRLGLEFFPKADVNYIYMSLENDIIDDLESTEKLSKVVSGILSYEEEVTDYTVSIGNGLPKFYYTMITGNPSNDYAQFLIKLDLGKTGKFKSNTEYVDYLQNQMNQVVSGGQLKVLELEQGEPIGAPVRLRLLGSNLESLATISKDLQEVLKTIEGTKNIEDNFDVFVKEYYVDVDVDRASIYGVTKFDVQNEVSIALRGREATIFRIDDKETSIRVKTNIDNLESLGNLGIKSSFTNKKVLLKEIADIKLQYKVPVIRKYNREIEVTILSGVKPGYNSIEIQNILEKKLKEMNLAGIRYEFDGEGENIDEEFGGVGVMAIFALILIYLILMIQFKSFLQPIVIFASIPLSAVGSIMGLWLFRQPLSFTGLLGMVSLFGIVVNNAIVLIDYINQSIDNGETIEEACINAVEKRFRPIILSTTTTVMGLVPLVLSRTVLFTPMAISLMSGLIVSTVLTLIIVPVFFLSITNFFIWIRSLTNSRKLKLLLNNA